MLTQTNFKTHLMFLLCFVAFSPSLFATTMLGDTITITRHFPDLNTIFTSSSPTGGIVVTTVQEGTGDIVSTQPVHYSINPESNNIIIDFSDSNTGFGGTETTFDGISIVGFSQELLNATLVQSVGMNALVTFTQDRLNINMNGGNPTGNELINVSLTFSNPVPEPSSFIFLGLGVMFLGFLRKHSLKEVK